MQSIKQLTVTLYNRFVRPLSHDEDNKRREFIFNVLLLSVVLLIIVGLLVALINQVIQGKSYNGISPFVTAITLIALSGIYARNRYKPNYSNAYVFLIIFMLSATVGLYQYGYVLAPAILVYMLVIVMASILISVRAALVMFSLVVMALATISYVQIVGITKPDINEHYDPLNVANVAIFLVLFGIVLLVSALSNIEIERSLKRARQSEKELRKERNSLEIKVAKRTKELERAQVEKTLELYRFAEFGRLSSTILHDIADPLTAVSLNLEQIGGRKKTKVFNQVRDGIDHLEQYVHSARRQLRQESEDKVFDSRPEIKRVYDLLLPKARNEHVVLNLQLEKDALLYGDSLKFNQIIANLTANAIDAYNDDEGKRSKVIKIRSQTIGKRLVITIKDCGIGIDKNEINRIFEPFFTTKASQRGTGIGLTIVKQIITEDFKGRIKVTSSKNRGTTFTVTLALHHQ